MGSVLTLSGPADRMAGMDNFTAAATTALMLGSGTIFRLAPPGSIAAMPGCIFVGTLLLVVRLFLTEPKKSSD